MKLVKVSKEFSEFLQAIPPTAFSSPEDQEEMKARINDFELYLLSLPQEPLKTREYMAHKSYGKILEIPQGVALTGERYSKRCFNILLKGKITIITEKGVATFTAPEVIIPHEGSKKIGYAHEDTLWMNVFGSEDAQPDVEKVKEDYFDRTPGGPMRDSFKARLRDIEDYHLALEEFGVTPTYALERSRLIEDLTGFSKEFPWHLGVSNIQGVGFFVDFPIDPGQDICDMLVDGQRTPAGRYCNHSAHPNAVPVEVDRENVKLVALRHISPGDEISLDYRHGLERNFKRITQ